MLLATAVACGAQSCLSSEDMDAATRSALEGTARQFFDLAAKGDVATLRQDSIPSVASDFGGIEGAVKEHQADFSGATASPRLSYVLQAEGKEAIARAEFLCGVFGKSGQTANSAVFVIPNLPPGDYGVVILNVAAKSPSTLSFVLQKTGNDWKLAGFYARPSQIAGHDAKWFADKAREFKGKGQNHNAWFYFLEARDLLSPLPFMSTQVTDKLYDEMQPLQPSDMPVNGNAVDFASGEKSFKLTNAFPVGVGSDIDLVVKYAVPDVSNGNLSYQDNMALIKALATKYPELKDGFVAIVARAVEPSGKDFGTMLAVKEIK